MLSSKPPIKRTLLLCALMMTTLAFAPLGEEPLHDRWWRWDEFGNDGVQQTWATLHSNLKAYFDWCSERSLRIGYPLDRINAHRTMAAQYFA